VLGGLRHGIHGRHCAARSAARAGWGIAVLNVVMHQLVVPQQLARPRIERDKAELA
jgi:hypothetical protein